MSLETSHDFKETRNTLGFSKDAAKTILNAQKLAKITNTDIGIGNLLLAVILTNPHRAQLTLDAYNVSTDDLSINAIDFEENSDDLQKLGPDHEPDFNRHASEVKRLASRLAQKEGATEITPDHLLIGIVMYLDRQKPRKFLNLCCQLLLPKKKNS